MNSVYYYASELLSCMCLCVHAEIPPTNVYFIYITCNIDISNNNNNKHNPIETRRNIQ